MTMGGDDWWIFFSVLVSYVWMIFHAGRLTRVEECREKRGARWNCLFPW